MGGSTVNGGIWYNQQGVYQNVIGRSNFGSCSRSGSFSNGVGEGLIGIQPSTLLGDLDCHQLRLHGTSQLGH